MSISSSSSRFSSLPARPPTPPRDTSPQPDIELELDKALDLLEDSFDLERLTGDRPPRISTQTLQFTPPSSGGDHSLNSDKRRKRVEISPWSTYHSKHLDASNLRPLPPAGTPLKSILKASDTSLVVESSQKSTLATGHSATDFDSFQNMLDSVIEQLAEEGKDARGDAYVILQGALKHYEEVPGGVQALVNKMPILLEYIERDMASEGVLNMTVVTQAIKFTHALFHIPQASNAMDDDFREFVVERAITILADPNAPKAFTNHYLNLLGHQRFSTQIMTDKRVEKLLDIINSIHERVKGNNLIVLRLHVYKRLILQAPQSMALRLTPWFENVFHGMVSSMKDIRARAIEVGFIASKEFSPLRNTHKAISDILDREVDEGKFYVDFIVARLTQMVSKKEDAFQVPQIWSIVILLMKERPRHLDNWRHFKPWLRLFEKIMKYPDDEVRRQTVLAWNRFIYVVVQKDTVTESMTKLLRKVILVWLHEEKTDKTPVNARMHAMMAYTTLLYYALRPGLSTQFLTHSWRNFINEMAVPSDDSPRLDAGMMCQVLHPLLVRGKTKIWNEAKVFESQPSANVQDLPPLDSKWIRQNIMLVLKPIRVCLNRGPWESASIKSTLVRDMWLSLTQALAEAGSKEVTVSMELKDAIAHVTNMLHGLWHEYPESLSNYRRNGDLWMERFGFIISSAMASLSPLYFSERLLARNGEADFEAAPTPSHRSRMQVSLYSPLLHLLELVLRVGPDNISDESRLTVINKAIATCLDSRNTRRARLELLRDCTLVVMPLVKGRSVSHAAWREISRLALTTIQSPADETTALGKTCTFLVDILSAGILQDDVKLYEATEELYEAFSEAVARDAGDAGVTVAISEPIAASIFSKEEESLSRDALLHTTTLILKYNRHPKNQRALRQSHEALGTSSGHVARSTDFDPYHNLYLTIGLAFSAAYTIFDTLSHRSVRSLLTAFRNVVETCPISLIGLFLRKNQNSLAIWIEDKSRLLVNSDADSRAVLNEVLALWRSVISSLEKLPYKNTATLAALDILLVAGFSSSRREIVNATVAFWNESFAKQDVLVYPSSFTSILSRLRRILDIELPSFIESTSDENIVPLSFLDSQDDSLMSSPASPNKKKANLAPPRSSSRAKSSPKSSPKRAHSRTPVRKTAKSRLRHEDSQLQFAAIDSSPMDGNTAGSQLLTENQKEVMEKHRQEAAMMFPDIGTISSAPLNEASPDDSRLNILSGKRFDNGGDTPPLQKETPTKLGGQEVFMGSSPTPAPGRRSRSASSGRQRRITGPASSPPRSPTERIRKLDLHSSSEIVKDSFVDRSQAEEGMGLQDSAAEVSSTVEDGNFAPFEDEESEFPDSELDQGLDDTMPDVTSSDADILLNAQIENEMTAQQERRSPPEATVTTNFINVFVDAPTEPLPSSGIDEAEFVDASAELHKPMAEQETPVKREMTSESPYLGDIAQSRHETEAANRSSQVEDSFATVASSPAEDPPALSTRGSRKRKSGDAVPNTAASKRPKRGPDTEHAGEPQSSRSSQAPQRKRGPGRPRKYPVELTSSRLEAAMDLTTEDQATASSDGVSSQPPSVAGSSGSDSRRLSHVQVTPQHEKNRKGIRAKWDKTTEAEVALPKTSSQPERPILQPKSIIDRLKGMLTDLKSYAFGSLEEYHEADTIIAAMRKEGFRASERGEQQRMSE